MATLSYYDVLDAIHRTLYPRTYLEIGIRHGDSVALALPGTRVIGVDPAPSIWVALPKDAIVEKCTSDDFFDSGRIVAHLGGSPIDLSFIDGMHLWEFALRDFLNIERHSHTGSVVLIHDCLPRCALEAQRERASVGWTGDVWKLLYFLREERPDLDVTILDSPPSGLGVIRHLNPDRPDIDISAVVERYKGLDFQSFEADLAPSLRFVSGDWDEIRVILPEKPWQVPENISALLAERSRRRPSLATRARQLMRLALQTPPGRAASRARQRLLRR